MADASEPTQYRTRTSRTGSYERSDDWPAHGRDGLAVIVLGIATTLLATFVFSPASEAAATNKTVQGVVYDQFSNSLSGADVTVEIWGGSWPERTVLRTSQSAVTDSFGYYEVTINGNLWDPHNTISVTAVYGSDQTTRGVEADGSQYQTVDVHISLTIPEFGTAGMVIITMATICIFVTLRRHKARRGGTAKR